jgi:UDP-galactopyranose mutase
MKRQHYDYLIVGAGLFGAVFANEMKKKNKSCLVIDRRAEIGGNIRTEEVRGIQVHQYGAHIFHTSDRAVWDYVNQFAEFNHYINAPVAIYQDELYNLPFNMNTFSRLWGVKTPAEARQKIAAQIAGLDIGIPANLEEQALSLVGTDVYEKLIKGYTEKQWGRSCAELPSFIIKRLPLRFTYDNNYFNDPYQGIPKGGYTRMISAMLEGVEVRTGVDYQEFLQQQQRLADAGNGAVTYDKTIYTGMIDEFFGYSLGHLEYRSLRFESEDRPDCDNWQGNAVVNYTESAIPYTRIIEHKHFEFGQGQGTIITKEYPEEWKEGAEPYYPINDEKNTSLYERYRQLASQQEDILFGGRLGQYRYMDMDKVIMEALLMAKVADDISTSEG